MLNNQTAGNVSNKPSGANSCPPSTFSTGQRLPYSTATRPTIGE